MRVTPIERIKDVAASGDEARARAMLKAHLKQSPTADGWVLAATWTQNREAQIQFLRKALALDAWHTEANRMLHRLEGSAPKDAIRPKTDWDRKTGTMEFKAIDRSKARDLSRDYKDRQRLWTQFGCMFGLIFMFFTTGFALRAVGFISMGGLNTLLGQMAPVTEIDGVPLVDVEDAIYRITPALESEVSNQQMEIVDAGYVHQHRFSGQVGEQYAIFVQFLSFNANRVSRNVVIVASDGTDITNRCERETIIADAGDTGVGFICTLPFTGDYAVRILGRDGESVGAYFIGVEQLLF